MKKGISFAILVLLFVGTIFGPNMVKANLEADLDLDALKPGIELASKDGSYSIHPSWKKLGLIPGCN